MPWLVQHKCNVYQTEPGAYAAIKVDQDDEQLTQLLCPNCRETVFIKGHEWFDSAKPTEGTSLPPGFLITKSRVAG